MKRKKLIEQLRKLRGLIERGATEHERDTAQRIYDTLCQTHGITADELFEPKSVKMIAFRGEHERRLLFQIVAAVTDSTNSSVFQQGKKRTSRGFELTDAEFVKVDRLFRIYRKDMAAEMDRVYRAFVETNKIYPATARVNDADDITPEEYEELKRVVMMADVMTKSRVNSELRA